MTSTVSIGTQISVLSTSRSVSSYFYLSSKVDSVLLLLLELYFVFLFFYTSTVLLLWCRMSILPFTIHFTGDLNFHFLQFQTIGSHTLLRFTFLRIATQTCHGDEAADEAEVGQVVGVDGRGRVDLQTVVALAGVLEQAVHGVEDLVGQQEEPFAARRTSGDRVNGWNRKRELGGICFITAKKKKKSALLAKFRLFSDLTT